MYAAYTTIDVERIALPPAGKCALLLPGWLGRGFAADGHPGQYEPLLDGELGRYGQLVGVNFVGSHAPVGHTAAELADVVRFVCNHNDDVTLVGSSNGAMMLVYTLGLISPSVNAKVVLVDPPAGAESLVSLPNGALQVAAKKIGRLPDWLNFAPIQSAFNHVFCSGKIGSQEVIEVPPKWQGRSDELRTELSRVARASQQGFAATLCLEQVGNMARCADDPAYWDALKRADRFYQVTRILCTERNEVVQPGVSDPFYSAMLPRAERVKVPANHCTYLTRPGLWNDFLFPILNP